MKGGGAIGPMQQSSYPMSECGAKHPARVSPVQQHGRSWAGKTPSSGSELQPVPWWPILFSLPGAGGRQSVGPGRD